MGKGKTKGTRESDGHSGAYLTVCLALVMAVLVPLCLTLIEGARDNGIRLESECAADIGLNSILAEYHRELFRQYNLFAIDSSYGTDLAVSANTGRHLQNYVEKNLNLGELFLPDALYQDFLGIAVEDLEMTKVSIYTDGRGAVFRRRAVEAVEDQVAPELLLQLQEWLDIVDSQGLREKDIAGKKADVDARIQDYDGEKRQLSETEWMTIHIDNPTKLLEETRKKGILEIVTENADDLSPRSVIQSELVGGRMKSGNISQGNFPLEEPSAEEKLLEHFFFQEYLLQYMGHYGKEDYDNALLYQLEYLISGKSSDIDNLREVANALCALREAANTLYIFSDTEKCAAAETFAMTVASFLMVPEITGLLKAAVLMGWAYAESLYDVETLLAGGRIPMMKDDHSWHYGLEEALRLSDDRGGTGGTGLSYEDYLRVLMMFTDTEVLTMRAMDMVEADIRMTPGNRAFRLDGCYDMVEACIRLKGGNGREYEIVRQKQY